MSRLAGRIAAAALLLILGGICIYLASRASTGAAVAAAIAVACSLALLLLRAEPGSPESVSLSQVFDYGALLLPGALIVFFSFDSGGYFPASPAFAALVLVIVLVLRITLVDEPFTAYGRPLAIAACAFSGFAVWTLVSGAWSDAPGRAMVEFDRAFFYVLLLVLVGSVVRTSTRLRWLAAGLAAGAFVVAVAAVATRLAPDHFPTEIPAIGPQNLAYPLTYSNALGILCVLGGLLALYFATSSRLPLAARALGSAAVPVFAVTVYFTLSRGPVAAAAIGIVAFALLGRPRGLVTGLLATVPTSVIAIASAYQHHLLTSKTPASAAATAQGHKVAVVLVICVIVAGLFRVVLAPLDARLADYSLPERSRTPVIAAAWVLAALVLVVVALAAHAPSRISDQYHRFVETAQASPTQDIRKSVFDPSNRGLIDNWKVSLNAFGDHPLKGTGAGTYEVVWYQNRPAKQSSYNVTDGHSLYTEVLGELGIVGFLLLAIVIVAILLSLLPYRRGANRALYAGMFATTLAWAAHAGVDWDWEMPAITVIPIALGAAGLANHASRTRPVPVSQGVRVGFGLALLLTAVAPALVLASQRQVDQAVKAERAGDCTRAIERAGAAISTLDVRPDPYEAIALCQVKRGRAVLATQAMQRAVDKDPNNWRYHFELAAVRGGSGLDPRSELAAARRLNPYDAEVKQLAESVPPGDSAGWDLALALPSGASAQSP